MMRPVSAPAHIARVKTGAAAALALALLVPAAPAHAGRGSVRGANMGAMRASPPPRTAPAQSPQAATAAARNTASTAAAHVGNTASTAAAHARNAAAPQAAAARNTASTYAAHGVRGAYGTSAAARVQTLPAAPPVHRAAAAARVNRGPVWATTLPAGARGANYYGRPYYYYGSRYYRPYYYGGVPYYGYVWPPYYAYYEEPPVGAITVSNGGESLVYSDGSYYETTYEEGQTQYQVVPAPAGLRLPPGSLPAEFATVTTGGTTYVFYGNTFYERVADPAGDILMVVAEPPGVVTLKELPADFEPVPVGDLTYFRSRDWHYLSYLDPQGAELYLAVDPPAASTRAAAAAGGAPAPEPPPPAATPVVTMVVHAGTATRLLVAAEIDSAQARAGDVFEGTLAEDLMADGRLVAARGSRAYGKVVASEPGAGLALALTDLTIGGRVVTAGSEVARFGAGGAPAPGAGSGAQLQSDLAAAVDGAAPGAPQIDRLALAPGTPVEFRIATTLIVGVAAN